MLIRYVRNELSKAQIAEIFRELINANAIFRPEARYVEDRDAARKRASAPDGAIEDPSCVLGMGILATSAPESPTATDGTAGYRIVIPEARWCPTCVKRTVAPNKSQCVQCAWEASYTGVRPAAETTAKWRVPCQGPDHEHCEGFCHVAYAGTR